MEMKKRKFTQSLQAEQKSLFFFCHLHLIVLVNGGKSPSTFTPLLQHNLRSDLDVSSRTLKRFQLSSFSSSPPCFCGRKLLFSFSCLQKEERSAGL